MIETLALAYFIQVGKLVDVTDNTICSSPKVYNDLRQETVNLLSYYKGYTDENIKGDHVGELVIEHTYTIKKEEKPDRTVHQCAAGGFIRVKGVRYDFATEYTVEAGLNGDYTFETNPVFKKRESI